MLLARTICALLYAVARRMSVVLLYGICSIPAIALAEPAVTAAPYKGMAVSIHPLYLIAQAITKDVEQPVRLLDANVDGHSSQLSPKQLNTLKNANFILWMGADFEVALASNIKKSGNSANAVAINKYINNPYPARSLTAVALAAPSNAKLKSRTNPHIWLDPNKAIAIANFIAQTRSLQYPHYKPLYLRNLAAFTLQMQQATQTIQASRKALLGDSPFTYISYVDVYQAIEPTLGVTLKGSYTYEDAQTTPQHLQWLNHSMLSTPTDCIAAPPAAIKQFNAPATIAKSFINENLSAHNNFVIGWSSVARQLINCAVDSRKLQTNT